jgi:UDP-N-acetylglucosamine--N-acetylmuramyl-(pentapeptide) pyrophosphoryl-undecaprenol N-acetylglucosamine transferase
MFSCKNISIKIFLLEPNMVLGRANNFFLKFSEKIFCYTNSIKNFPSKFLNKIVLINL